MMLIPVDALYRTGISTVLKSVGITARIFDIPQSQGDLRKRVAQRELLDLGVIVGASLVLEGVSHALGPKRKLKGLFQFLPQLGAYVFAEWFSRKATNYNAYLNSHLKNTAKPDAPVLNIHTAPPPVASPALATHTATSMSQPHYASLETKPASTQATAAYATYPTYWQPTARVGYSYY